eukprot:6203879-Pleurochrysis_carterae.AAC.2
MMVLKCCSPSSSRHSIGYLYRSPSSHGEKFRARVFAEEAPYGHNQLANTQRTHDPRSGYLPPYLCCDHLTLVFQ